MNNLFPILISLLFCIAAGGIIWVLSGTARKVTYVTLADGRRQERSLPMIIRALLPLSVLVPRWLTGHSLFEDSRQRAGRRLVSGGYEGLVKPHEIIALRLLVPLVIGTLMCILLYFAFPIMPESIGAWMIERQFYIYLVVLVFFGFYPDTWLRYSVRKRHRSIERSLPFVLDLLTLSVESGLDFMSGISRIINYREIDALGEELVRVFREIQVGRSRKEALRNMSQRVDHVDIRALTSALIQADELGTGIGHALRIQAEQVRGKRFQRAEKMGNEAPVKLLFPLVAFIFPSVFMILLGPLFLQLWIQGGF
ncbi:MAG: type II secretion system F family protein [Pontiellaceae bacterium]|nr:type II secretion system F family protein [Pontiellaceae bacterium]MBN2784319.1 type II secretion system F family protein [Pontiellaceae bacterium]